VKPSPTDPASVEAFAYFYPRRAPLAVQDDCGAFLEYVRPRLPAMVARYLKSTGGMRAAAVLTVRQLWREHGLTERRACALRAAFELSQRSVAWSGHEWPAIRDPEDVAHLLRPRLAFADQEVLIVLVMDTKHTVRRVVELYRGTVCSASVRVAEVIRPAIVDGQPNLIVAHNHPSGDPTPSPEDISVTRRIREAAELHDLGLLDHVVIGARGFVSMKQRALGFDGARL